MPRKQKNKDWLFVCPSPCDLTVKTHSGAKKRFSLTKSGKVKRAHANKRHLLNGHDKDTKRKRGLRAGAYADRTNEAAIKRMILYK